MGAIAGYIFGYGSLLDPASIASTLSGEHAPLTGPWAAQLSGYRRVWNVAVPSGPGQRRPLQYPGGTPYQHDIACLGLEPVSWARCQGAVYAVDEVALRLLDEREARYDRVDVSELIHAPEAGLRPGPPGDRRPGDCSPADLPRIGLASDTVVPIWTYIPKPHVPVRFEQLLAAGQLVVTAHYLRTVERGMRLLGDDVFAAYRAEPAPPCPVTELIPSVAGSDSASGWASDWDGGWAEEAVG